MESVPSWAEHLVPWGLKLGEHGALGIGTISNTWWGAGKIW